MSFKKMFNKNELKPYFKFNQNGNIWRLFFNNADFVAGETRDIRTKQAYLFTYDVLNKREYLRNFQFDEKWWFAIDALADETIIVSNFQKPEMPEHRGFKVLDIRTGKVLWENIEYEFFFASDEYIFAVKQLFESRVIFKLNLKDGSVLSEYRGEDIESITILKSENDLKIYEGLINTEIMGIQDSYLKGKYPAVFDKLAKLKKEGEVEYIEMEKYLILNHHSIKGINLKDLNESVLTNTLEIYNSETSMLEFEDILNKNTSSYVPDSFFIRNNYLFYIKEKSELVCIKLNN